VLACVLGCGHLHVALAYLSHTLVAPSAYPPIFQYLLVSHRDPFLDHLQAGRSMRLVENESEVERAFHVAP